MFIDEYLRTWNATRAAIYAGYSEKTARAIGSENLTKPDIKVEIEKRLKESAMSTDEILSRLADIARASYEDIVDSDENGHPSVGLDVAVKKNKVHLIKAIVPTRNGIKYEFHDPIKALELLGKAQGLFTDKVDVTSQGEKITTDDGHDRAILTLAATLREILPGEGAKPDGAVDTSE